MSSVELTRGDESARHREVVAPDAAGYAARRDRSDGLSVDGTVTDGDMWGVLAEAATMLDASDCDWRMLQQIEGMLRSLSRELERATTVETPHAPNGSSRRRAGADLGILQGSLAWVRQHEYDALESELHQQLDTALRCAMATLDRLEGSQQEFRSVSAHSVGPGDRR